MMALISRIVDLIWEYFHRDELFSTQMKRMRNK
jgi:hypothetical protein